MEGNAGNATFVFEVSETAEPGTVFRIMFSEFRPWMPYDWEKSDDSITFVIAGEGTGEMATDAPLDLQVHDGGEFMY